MKIGIFLQDLSSGGAEKIMVGFANYLAEHTNDEVFLILVRKKGTYLQDVSSRVKLINLNKTKTLYAFKALCYAINKYRFDFLYSTLVNANILALMASKLLGVKLIIREANTIELSRKKEHRLLIKVANKLSVHLYNWCYKCIAISQSVKEDLIKHSNCDEKKIAVIYNPVIINDSVKVKVDKSLFQIGFVSRLTTQKNIPTICKIIDRLLNNKRNVQFHFFGEGDSDEIEKVQLKYNAFDKVILHGFEHSYYSYIKQMDMFIHIPLWEGLGNSVLEVYHSGIPMILSNVKSGFSELIEKQEVNIHYVDPFDDSGIVNIIENYINGNVEVGTGRKKLDLYADVVYKSYRELANQ